MQDYRFCVILRGPGLDGHIADTDPQVTAPTLPAGAQTPEAEYTAELFNQWIAEAREILKDESRPICLRCAALRWSPTAAFPRGLRSESGVCGRLPDV